MLLEKEDSLIYGAISGLGFSFTENILYALNSDSLFEAIFISSLRQLTSTNLHIYASSKVGSIFYKTTFNKIKLRYLEGVFYHFLHNGSITFTPEIFSPFLLFFMVYFYRRVHKKLINEIKTCDRESR